jgi:uncharacterized membrane protein
MTDVRARYKRLFDSGDSTDRIEFFSDAVFAIAMTLLVLDIAVPASHDHLLDSLLDLVPEAFAYVLSFVIIGVNWAAHHRKFRVIEHYDRTLINLNLVLLLFVAFVPFPTALLSQYAETPSVVLYAVSVAAMSVLQYLLWAHARRAGLMSASVDHGVYRFVRRNLLITPAVFGVSIIIALLGYPLIAMYSWIALWPANVISGRITRPKKDELEPATS